MPVAALFIVTSLALGLPPALLDSIAYVESSNNAGAIRISDGSGDSIGLMQIKYNTAYEVGWRPPQNLFHPKWNIEYAGRYLRKNYDLYHSWYRAVCAYNRGVSTGNGHNTYTTKVFKRLSTNQKWCYFPRTGRAPSKRGVGKKARKKLYATHPGVSPACLFPEL